MAELKKVNCDRCGEEYEWEDYAPMLAESYPDGCFMGDGQWWCRNCITCKVCGCFCIPNECRCSPFDQCHKEDQL